MFLSKLVLDPRSGDVRRDLRDPYELHRTLMRAFPTASAGGPGRVLFRIEPIRDGSPVVLVQSEKEPTWGRLPERYADPGDGPKELPLDALTAGRILRFRLRANPTKRLTANSVGPDGKPVGEKWAGKRVGLYTEDEQLRWLARHAESGGFRVRGVRVVPEDRAFGHKGGATLTLLAVRFEGVLEVTNAATFCAAVTTGLGPGKGLGFGLLSLAPAGV